MATEKLYLWSRDMRGEARITALLDGEKKIVRLARTLFHPQGGGQRADQGTIAGRPVLDVRHAPEDEVDHVVASLDGLNVGETVPLNVDAVRRHLHARLHSAGHLIADGARSSRPDCTARPGITGRTKPASNSTAR